MNSESKTSTIGRLLGDAMHQLSKLIQNEIRLAKAEILEKATVAMMGAAFLAAAALVGMAVLVVLLIAIAVWFIELGLSPSLAYLASVIIGAVVAGVLAMLGLSRLKAENLTPRVTIQQLGRDIDTAKEIVK